MTLFTIITGILLVVLNVRALKKEESSFSNRLHEADDNMEEFEVRLGEVRKEFSETIFELQKEVEDLKEIVAKLESVQAIPSKLKFMEDVDTDETEADPIIYKPSPKGRSKKKETEKELDKGQENGIKESNNSINQSNNSIKVDEIGRLLEEGLTIDEISQKLSIGKGEVLLIKELYLR